MRSQEKAIERSLQSVKEREERLETSEALRKWLPWACVGLFAVGFGAGAFSAH